VGYHMRGLRGPAFGFDRIVVRIFSGRIRPIVAQIARAIWPALWQAEPARRNRLPSSGIHNHLKNGASQFPRR
jgi:hypothetical protein